MKRIVITGPTGAIGMALIQKCIEEGIEVLALCRKESKRADRIPEHPLIRKEFCSLSGLRSFCLPEHTDYDVFYHLAWEAPVGAGRENMHLQLKNVEYALDAVALAERLGCHTFIGAGSQAEYGRVEGKLSEQTPVNPESGYGIAKLCAGQMTRKECEKRGLRHIWTRILSVYGPYDGEQTMISSCLRALLAGEKPSLTKGEQKWDYLYSADAAKALLLLGDKGKDGSVYVLGRGEAKPLYEYVYQMRDLVNPELPLGIGEVPYGERQVMYLCADLSKLEEDTGFLPETGFSEGIKKTIEWMRNKSRA